LRNGKILDKESLKESIRETLKECEKRVGEEYIDEIVIGVSHPQLKTMRIQEQKRILEAEITNDDVQHLSRIITDTSLTPNYDILKIIPVHWIINESSYTKNPIGEK
jgi:cell division ATPase FtsA